MARRKSWLRSGLVVLFCLLFAVAAFAGGNGEKPAASKGIVVGLSNGPFTHSWRVQMAESLQQQFEVYRDKGWVSKLIIQNAGPDVNTQIAQIPKPDREPGEPAPDQPELRDGARPGHQGSAGGGDHLHHLRPAGGQSPPA